MAGYSPVSPIIAPSPSPSILSVAGRLVDVDWREGVAWSALCQRGDVWPRCQTDPTARKCEAEERALVQVDSFAIYAPLACDWQNDGETFASEAAAHLDSLTAYHVGNALWMGRGLPPGHLSLRQVAVDVTVSPGVGVHPLTAISTLLANYERCAQRGGAVLHVPSILIPFLMDAQVVSRDGPMLRGPLGSLVSPGPGYPQGATTPGPDGAGPWDGSQFLGNLADETWVYVSGPVEVGLGEVMVIPDAPPAELIRQNTREVWAERLAIVRLDPCCVFAALVEVPSP